MHNVYCSGVLGNHFREHYSINKYRKKEEWEHTPKQVYVISET